MKITIECTHCRTEYTVDDRHAGKRVKCKKCGEVFDAAAAPHGASLVDFAALEQLEPTGYVPPPIDAKSYRQRLSAAPGFATGVAVESTPAFEAPPILRTRRGRVAGPLDDLIHDKLPLLLIVVGLVIPILVGFVMLIHYNPEPTIIFTYFKLIGAFVCITIPTTVVGLRIAAHVLDFELVDSAGFRILAAFSASGIVQVLYLLFVHLPVLHGPPQLWVLKVLSWVVGDVLIGTIASFGLVKLFFYLRFGQAVATWFIASTAWFIGNIASVLLVVLVLWLAGMVFSMHPSPTSSSTPSTPEPDAPVAAAAKAAPDKNKEDATRNNLQQISLYLKQYYSATGKYPDALEILAANQNMPAQLLHSPFGTGTANDYAYFPYPYAGEPGIHDWIVAYDKAENDIEGCVMILRGNGEVQLLDSGILQFTLNYAHKSADEDHQRLQALAAVNPPAAPPIAPLTPPAPIEPVLPPTVPKHPPAPVEPIDRPTGPAWAADVDAPVAMPTISTHLRQIFNGTEDLTYSQNGGAWLVVDPEPTPSGASFRNPITAELWNLRTLKRATRYPALQPMHDTILSPAGDRLVGRTLGGGDASVAVAFEVWSARSGKFEHTLATPPIAGTAIPKPIGFPDADQLLTAGEELDVWDLKTGNRLRQFGDNLTLDAKTLIAPSPNCQLAAILASDDSGVWLVSVKTGKTLGEAKIDVHKSTGDARAIQFSPDGKEIAALVGGQRIYVWDVPTGQQQADFDLGKPIAADAGANTLQWMPDGQGWLIGGNRIVDRQLGDCVYPLPAVTESGGQEFGARCVIDNAHLVTQFRTTAGDKTALEVLPIDSDFVTTRTALRADRDALKNPATPIEPK